MISFQQKDEPDQLPPRSNRPVLDISNFGSGHCEEEKQYCKQLRDLRLFTCDLNTQ